MLNKKTFLNICFLQSFEEFPTKGLKNEFESASVNEP